MKKKEFTAIPIRSLEKSPLFGQSPSNFGIDILAPEPNQNQLIVPPHRHDYYHIMLVKKGIGKHTIDFKRYPIHSSTMFFISPGQVHSLELDEAAEGYVISFNSSFYHINENFQKLLDYPFFHSLNNSPFINLNTEKEKIIALWDELYEEYQAQRKNKEKLLRALLDVLLIRASRVYHSPKDDTKPIYMTYQLRKLETLIDQHFKEHRLLNDYAELMYISPRQLNSICKKGLNKTVVNLLHERLLIEAKRLLLFTNNSIHEIAYELGFADTSYFMRFFKKHTSSTADAYRNQDQF